METKKIQTQFEIFEEKSNFVYLDNASTALVPETVSDAIEDYYEEYPGNIHRGLYEISEKATKEYEEARGKVAKFVGADADEIVFTSGATMGLNILAQSIGKDLGPGDSVVMTQWEHHSNLIPWQQSAKRYGFELRFIKLARNVEHGTTYELDLSDAEEKIDENTKVLSVCHVSNTLGSVVPLDALFSLLSYGAITIVDAAQSVPHVNTSVRDIDCDFLVFSGHKMYGPKGIGVLYGKRDRLEVLDPVVFGGGMVQDVSWAESEWGQGPAKFEPGTPNIGGAIGLGVAIDFIHKVGLERIREHENKLTSNLINKLTEISSVKIIGPLAVESRGPVVSFTLDGVHSHDIAQVFADEGVAIRAGHHCTMPLMKELGISGTARISFGIYNTQEDVEKAVACIEKVKEIFSV